MKIGILFISMVLLECLLARQVFPQNQFDKGTFYSVISGKNIKEIDQQLSLLTNVSVPDKDAYVGALLAKKAGIVTKPKDKLSLFKEGKTKIEAAIGKSPDNPELRFLRLMIQEHSPRNVNYKKHLTTDSEFIRQHFKSLTVAIQKIVIDYSRSSTVLKPADF